MTLCRNSVGLLSPAHVVDAHVENGALSNAALTITLSVASTNVAISVDSLAMHGITQAAVVLSSATTVTGASPQRHDVTQ